MSCPLFDCGDEPIGGAVAGREVVGREQEQVSGCSFGDDDWRLTCSRDAHGVRLIVAMVGVERHRQPGRACPPFGALADGSVGDLAEGAVAAAELGSDPVRYLAAQGAAGVVDPDEPDDASGRVRVRGSHPNSIADRTLVRGLAFGDRPSV